MISREAPDHSLTALLGGPYNARAPLPNITTVASGGGTNVIAP